MANDLNIGLGLRFQPGLQEGLVSSRGIDMIHEIGIACTCRVEDVYASTRDDGTDRRREPFCSRCGQDGFLFRSPEIIEGIFTGVRHQRNVLDSGNYLPGDAIFSPSPNSPTCTGQGRRIGTADKLTATWSEPIDEGQVLIRGSGNKAAAGGVLTQLADDEDRLWYEPSRLIWCEDEFGVIYESGADFELGPGKVIKWRGHQPVVGVKYSIKYEAFFEWIVWQPPTERVENDANLGELVNLRKRHLKLINDSPFASSDTKASLQTRVTM